VLPDGKYYLGEESIMRKKQLLKLEEKVYGAGVSTRLNKGAHSDYVSCCADYATE